MTPQGWEEISKLSQLEVLDVSSSSNISNTDVAKFMALTNLRELNLSETPITDDAFKSLAEMEGLEILKIEGNGLLKGHGLQAYTRSKPALRELHAMHSDSRSRPEAHQVHPQIGIPRHLQHQLERPAIRGSQRSEQPRASQGRARIF